MSPEKNSPRAHFAIAFVDITQQAMRLASLGLALLAACSATVSAQEDAPLVNVIVTMKTPQPRELSDMKAIRRRLRKRRVACDAETRSYETDHDEQVTEWVSGLVAHANETHAPVLDLLQNTTAEPTSLWITNEVAVRDATPELVEQLRAMPEVGDVRVAKIARLPVHMAFGNVSANASTSTSAQQNTWALDRIQAPRAWQQGFNGTGLRVAAADSGVLATHTSLAGRMQTDFGWFDAVDGSATPVDPLGHGTSVLSIMTGANSLGVAPAATWLACRACDDTGTCDETWMLTCAQFLLCPTNAQQQMDCAKRPHVINMSWNYDTMDERALETVVSAWLTAGIVPVFSNGNRGPKCKTVRSPADWTSGITVGATTSTDDIAPASARGPSLSGEIKPDLSAPGMDVVGAHITNPTAVVAFTGTSASAPFVSGAVALMLQANPALKPATIKQLLTRSTDQTSLVPHVADSCLATATTDTAMVFPNNIYGHGRLNVWNAVTLATQTPSRR